MQTIVEERRAEFERDLKRDRTLSAYGAWQLGAILSMSKEYPDFQTYLAAQGLAE